MTQGGSGRLAEDVQERRGGGRSGAGGTGTPDPTYGLVSTVYHLLQGAETVQRYIEDAQGEGDKDVAKFLKQVQRNYVKNADQAKQLLAQRLS